MHRFLAILFGLAIILVGLVVFAFNAGPVDAGPQSKWTLSAGQKLLILANGCGLGVTTKTAKLVIIDCLKGKSAQTLQPLAPTAKKIITLNSGDKLTVNASACTLRFGKNQTNRMALTCFARIPKPTATYAHHPNP